MEYLRSFQTCFLRNFLYFVSILLLQWNTYEESWVFFGQLENHEFQSFFYNGIPTKAARRIITLRHQFVSILLLQWNTYEAFVILCYGLIEFKFQSFFYNGIPTKSSFQYSKIAISKFQSFFYNGIPTKLHIRRLGDYDSLFQSFFYNGIPTKSDP